MTRSLEDAQLQMEQVEDLLATLMDARAAALDATPTRLLTANDAKEKHEEEKEMAGNAPRPLEDAAEREQEEDEANAEEDDDDVEVEEAHIRSPTLSLSLLEGGDRPVQWNLISPWSEADDDDDAQLPPQSPPPPQRSFFNADDSAEHATTTAQKPEPEPEMQIEERLRELIKAESFGSERDEIRSWSVDADEDDEEFEVFSAGAFASIDELFDETLESAADGREDELDDCTSVASTLDDSCDDSPRVSAASRFLRRRLRAQSYTGAAASSVQSAFAKFRSRTLSSTRSSASHASSSSEAEDGDFTGDGHAFSSRPALSARLGSVGSLKMAAGRMSFLRFRSSSATTTASDDSLFSDLAAACGSPGDEVHSAPALSTIDSCTSAPAPAPSHVQMQTLKLKATAAASKAAGFLNAASSEAARKLKSRALRSPVKHSDIDISSELS